MNCKKYYLNNFITIISVTKAIPETIAQFDNNYKTVIDIVRVLYRESKNEIDTIIFIFGIKIDTNSSKANRENWKSYHYKNCNTSLKLSYPKRSSILDRVSVILYNCGIIRLSIHIPFTVIYSSVPYNLKWVRNSFCYRIGCGS